MRGEHKSSNYKRIRSAMVTLFTKYLDLPHRYFNNIVIRDSSDSEPFEAYSRSDLNQLLPFLRSLFKKLISSLSKTQKSTSTLQTVKSQ